MKKRIPILLLSLLAGCFHASDEEMDLRTVPVTNNPYVVPNNSGSFPGGGAAPSPGPY